MSGNPITPVKFKNRVTLEIFKGNGMTPEVLKSFIEERHKGYSKVFPVLLLLKSILQGFLLTVGYDFIREIVHRIKAVRDLAHENPKLVNKGDLAAFARAGLEMSFYQKLEDQPSIEHACMHGAFSVRAKHGSKTSKLECGFNWISHG